MCIASTSNIFNITYEMFEKTCLEMSRKQPLMSNEQNNIINFLTNSHSTLLLVNCYILCHTEPYANINIDDTI